MAIDSRFHRDFRGLTSSQLALVGFDCKSNFFDNFQGRKKKRNRAKANYVENISDLCLPFFAIGHLKRQDSNLHIPAKLSAFSIMLRSI